MHWTFSHIFRLPKSPDAIVHKNDLAAEATPTPHQTEHTPLDAV